MIKKIEINYPEWDLKLEREFTEGVNLIEEVNAYGKTTILNTILSLYSKKYPGLRTLPSGTAKIYADDKVYMLNKGIWVGMDEKQNSLVKYILPGEFFAIDTTPKQRATLVELLGIDYAGFMTKRIPGWYPDMKKETKARIKSNEGKNEVILDDIIRLESIVIKYEKNPVVIEDTSQNIESVYALQLRKHNDLRMQIMQDNNLIVNKINRISDDLRRATEKQEALRNEFRTVATACKLCGWPIDPTERKNQISKEGKELTEEIKKLSDQLAWPWDKKDVPEPWPDRTLQEKADYLKLKLTVATDEQYKQVAEYDAAKKELSLKKSALKALSEINDISILDSIQTSEKAFTDTLNTSIKELDLEIELFKKQENGEIVESFQISLEGKPYSELSGGNRALLQLKMALAFVKKLGLDFILLDEAGTISQKNFDVLKKECAGLQVIICRASPFKMKK